MKSKLKPVTKGKKYVNLHAPEKTLVNTRLQVKQLLTTLNPTDIHKMESFENAIYEYSIGYARKMDIPEIWDNINFRTVYMKKSRSIVANLKRDSNLLTIDSKELVHMDNFEMAPDVWREAISNAFTKRDKVAIIRAEETE
jgi:hypothetical protein